MRNVTFLILFLLTLLAGSQTNLAAQITSAAPNLSCGAACGNGGGGGGGGGGTPPVNHDLNVLGFNNYDGNPLSGVSGREAPGAAIFLNPQSQRYLLYIAYTPGNDPFGDAYNDQYMHLLAFDGNGSFIQDHRINSNGNPISDVNPALQSFHGSLYLASAAQNQNNNGGFWNVASSTDGTNFFYNVGFDNAPSYALYSPTLTTDGAYLYVAITNVTDQRPILCRVDTTNHGHCFYFPGNRAINFNPGVAVFNGALYMSTEDQDNAHALRVYVSRDQGQSFSELTQLQQSQDQTSVAPSLVTYLGALYVCFRTNDADHKFIYRYSTDGTNFTTSKEPANEFTLRGTPTMVDGSLLPGGHLYTYFGNDSSSPTVYQAVANHY